MIANEYIREIQTKINCQKNINDIIKCVLGEQNKLKPEQQQLVLEHVNRDNLVWFYETLIYAGGLGEFYTPKCIVDLCQKIMGEVGDRAIYEPTIGSGNLVSGYSNVYGQEFNEDSYELTKLLHPNWKIGKGDTLSKDAFEEMKFDHIITNPPYGGSGWKPFEHEKFAPVQVPKKAIEMAFVQHCVWKLSDTGRMVAVLPHGVLFRGNKEKEVRESLIPIIDTVIGLPANLFSNTSIPVCIIVFDKQKLHDGIHFIDASQEFVKDKKINVMTEDNINNIYTNYKEKKYIDKFASWVDYNEIRENDSNLNIPRYVDTFEPEEEIDILEVLNQMREVERETQKIKREFINSTKELNGQIDKIKALIEIVELI